MEHVLAQIIDKHCNAYTVRRWSTTRCEWYEDGYTVCERCFEFIFALNGNDPKKHLSDILTAIVTGEFDSFQIIPSDGEVIICEPGPLQFERYYYDTIHDDYGNEIAYNASIILNSVVKKKVPELSAKTE